MTAHFHPSLTQEKWNALTKDKQILNIAAELSRAEHQRERKVNLQNSLERSMELIDLTIADSGKWKGGALHELLRFREHLGNFYADIPMPNEEMKRAIRCLLDMDAATSTVEI